MNVKEDKKYILQAKENGVKKIELTYFQYDKPTEAKIKSLVKYAQELGYICLETYNGYPIGFVGILDTNKKSNEN